MEAQEVAGSQFSVSQQESSAKGAVLENALDIKVNEHSLLNNFLLLKWLPRMICFDVPNWSNYYFKMMLLVQGFS